MTKKFVIIGASAAGIGCALRLRIVDTTAQITVLTAEVDFPYNKCFLADVLLGEKEIEAINFCTESMLAEKHIDLIRSASVVAIDSAANAVLCDDGRQFRYDALCIATGKSPRKLPLFHGKRFINLINFYYKSDLTTVINYIDQYKPRRAVVIGAGLTGLEVADGLRVRGLQVTIIEAAAHFLPNLLDDHAATVIMEQSMTAGITLRMQEIVIGYEAADDRIMSLTTSSGNVIVTDLVICAIGAVPNTDCLPPSLTLSQGYCIVDETMRTSIPAIYAAGDCCMVYDRIHKKHMPSSLWPDAMQQGMYAAYGMSGMPKSYPGSVSIASSSFFGIKVAIAAPVSLPVDYIIKESEGPGWYHRFIYDNEKLCGFILIGNTQELSHYRRELLST